MAGCTAVSEEDTTIVISRVATIVIIAGTITPDTVTAFSIRATILITATNGPDPVSRFHSTSCHMLAFTCFQETNSGDASFVRET